MWKKELCLGISGSYNQPASQLLPMYQEAGFDGFFSDAYAPGDETAVKLAAQAKELGLRYQSIHADFLGSADIWHGDDEQAARGMLELTDALDKCIRAEVPILVAHTYIGFEPSAGPSQRGVDRYGQVVRRAEEAGVKIAFENTEGEEYLFALMDAFRGNDAVGFCWDSGHEMCYNHSRDLLAKLGDRLIATHLNDNLGIRDFAGGITWLDDLHLLPFDGIADWDYNVSRLKKCGFDGPLTFELIKLSKPGRHDNDLYAAMDLKTYLAQVYQRACRVAAKF